MDSTLASQLTRDGLDEWMIQAVNRLARGRTTALDGCLVTVGQPQMLDATQATVRCHFVARDGNGRPRVKALAKRVANRATDYCIPRSRIEQAHKELLETGSTSEFTRLQNEAKDLFTDLETSGEGGELLLFILMESVLRIPQLLCKMPLKTNPRVHYHGVDGVHAQFLPGGNLALYWGESKLHASVSGAIDDCFESLTKFLDADEEAADRDLMLVRDHLDVADIELAVELFKFFDDEDAHSARVELRGACLVGFSLDDYPDPFEASGGKVAAAVAASIDKWHQRIAKRLGERELSEISMEIFLVPMPSVAKFRSAMLKRLGKS